MKSVFNWIYNKPVLCENSRLLPVFSWYWKKILLQENELIDLINASNLRIFYQKPPLMSVIKARLLVGRLFKGKKKKTHHSKTKKKNIPRFPQNLNRTKRKQTIRANISLDLCYITILFIVFLPTTPRSSRDFIPKIRPVCPRVFLFLFTLEKLFTVRYKQLRRITIKTSDISMKKFRKKSSFVA